VLVAPLLALVAVCIVQLILTMHTRNLVTLAASEGARAAARAGSNLNAGVTRSRTLLYGAVADDVIESIAASATRVDGIPVIAVSIVARVPVVGLPITVPVNVTGRAVREGGDAW
jgi:Flp pilus assembly protein TadG